MFGIYKSTYSKQQPHLPWADEFYIFIHENTFKNCVCTWPPSLANGVGKNGLIGAMIYMYESCEQIKACLQVSKWEIL